MEEQKPKCSVELRPMKDWLEEDDPVKCRPCMMGPVVQWYESELRDKQRPELAAELIAIAEGDKVTPSQLGEKLDMIKAQVGEPIRERLLEFDCAAQSYEEGEEEKPAT